MVNSCLEHCAKSFAVVTGSWLHRRSQTPQISGQISIVHYISGETSTKITRLAEESRQTTSCGRWAGARCDGRFIVSGQIKLLHSHRRQQQTPRWIWEPDTRTSVWQQVILHPTWSKAGLWQRPHWNHHSPVKCIISHECFHCQCFCPLRVPCWYVSLFFVCANRVGAWFPQRWEWHLTVGPLRCHC